MHSRSIRMVEDDMHREWDSVAGHPLQSWAWGEFRKRMGLRLIRMGVYSGERLTDVFQFTLHPIPHTPWTVGYLPKGPMLTAAAAEALRNVGRKNRTVFIQVEPNITSHMKSNEKTVMPFTSVRPSHHPLFTKYTFVLDLTKPDEEFLRAMHPKTRYNIKVARKHGVTVTEDVSDEAFAQYLSILRETTHRQEFYAHNEQYHRTMWDVMRNAGVATLFRAQYRNQTLAAWILFRWKDTLYYPYGASSRQNREAMAPTLMLYETARWGKTQGLKRYDLWGAIGPEPDEKDPWYGFHRFKQGFGPELVEFIGSFDIVIRPFHYEFYKLADALRWQLLRLKSKTNQ